MVGACGLIFTFTAGAQTAGGGTAAVGGTASAGNATAAPAATGSTVGATAAPGTAAQGQSLSTIPGQNVSVSPPTVGVAGQPGLTAPAGSGTTISAPNTAGTTQPATAGTTANTSGANAIGTTTAATGVGTTTRSQVSFNSLPAAVQSQIAAQVPAGAQLGAIIAETTPQGTTYRAQVMQNGVISEMALSGVGTTTGFATTTTTSGTLPGVFSSGGFVVGTPYGYEQLPPAVQTAFAAQGAAGATNITFTPAGNGGVFHAMINGKPVDVRIAANGQIIPTTATRDIASNTINTTKLDDLPVAVRDAIRANAPFAEITSIRKSATASGDVYDITMRANDRLAMMQISDNGTIIKENHDLAAAITSTASAVLTNEPPKLAWNSLPTAVRDSIEVHTTPETVKTLALTNYLGKTAYVVDYVDRDAIRNRLYLNKEGLVMDTQTNLFGIAMTGKPVAIDDLPEPARAAVQEQAEKSAVTRIDLAMYGLTPVYVVTYQREGEARQMVISREGRRMQGNVGAPAATVIGSEKATSEGENKATELK